MTTSADTYEATAHTFDEFRALIEKAKKRLTEGPNDNCVPPEFWYRGHDRGVYTLTPSLFRYREAAEKEKRLFDYYAQAVVGHPGQKAVSWETVFGMQHYGIPTRLLDWTAKLWIAVFYALTPSRVGPCIYILNPLRLNKKNRIDQLVRVPEDCHFDFDGTFPGNPVRPILHPLAILPTPLNDRMRSQCSRFTVQGAEPEALETQSPDSVGRIFLDDTACTELQTFLDDTNITPFVLFPDHEGIAQFVIAKAALERIPYDEGTASKIRR